MRLGLISLLMPVMATAQSLSQSELAARITDLSQSTREQVDIDEAGALCPPNLHIQSDITLEDCTLTFTWRSRDEDVPYTEIIGTVTTNLSFLTLQSDQMTGLPYHLKTPEKCWPEGTGQVATLTFVSTSTGGLISETGWTEEGAANLRPGILTDPIVTDHGADVDYVIPNVEDEGRLHALTGAIAEYKMRFCAKVS